MWERKWNWISFQIKGRYLHDLKRHLFYFSCAYVLRNSNFQGWVCLSRQATDAEQESIIIKSGDQVLKRILQKTPSVHQMLFHSWVSRKYLVQQPFWLLLAFHIFSYSSEVLAQFALRYIIMGFQVILLKVHSQQKAQPSQRSFSLASWW